MRKRSDERRIEQSIELGRQNVECIRGVTGWCKHVRLRQESAGMLAEMTNLPIGMITISCPHSTGGSSSMNLPWIVPEFILRSCVGCTHHSPNGDTKWAERIIEEAKMREAERKAQAEARTLQLAEMRNALRKIPKLARTKAPVQEHKVLELLEELFDNDSSKHKSALTQLVESASIGSELFSNEIIEFLLKQSLTPEYGRECLSICGKLAEHRKDLAHQFASTALEAIRREIWPEVAAGVLAANLDKTLLPLERKIPSVLIKWQSYHRPIGGHQNGEPEYLNSINVLFAYYEIAPEFLCELIREQLSVNDKHVRYDVCGVISALRQLNPRIAIDLLGPLIDSLCLDDDIYDGSADYAASREIAAAFQESPEAVDKILWNRILSSEDELQKLLIVPYDIILGGRDWKPAPREEKGRKQINPAEKLAFERCLAIVRDDRIEIETRIDAAEALNRATDSVGELIIQNFEAILGYLALISLQTDPPKAPPRIIVPGSEQSNPIQSQLDDQERKRHWHELRSKITDLLEEIAEKHPEGIIDSVVQCYETTNTTSHERLKAELLTILGKVGKAYSCQPKAVPVLMKGLMDFDSALIRATAIRAVEEAFRYSNANPPENLVDVLVLHLRDQYVAVHKSALQFVRFRSYTLSDSQRVQALRAIAVHAEVYKDQPFDLDDICDAILEVSHGNAAMRRFAIKVIKRFFPTGEELADEKIAESLTSAVKPTDEEAMAIAGLILTTIQKGKRDRFNSYDHQKRHGYFRWLSQLPERTYREIRPTLLKVAAVLAAEDPFESCLFAEVFSVHDDFEAEADVLNRAEKGTLGEKSLGALGAALQTLKHAALANLEKTKGNVDKAIYNLKNIRTDEK